MKITYKYLKENEKITVAASTAFNRLELPSTMKKFNLKLLEDVKPITYIVEDSLVEELIHFLNNKRKGRKHNKTFTTGFAEPILTTEKLNKYKRKGI